jgi:HlyD family secretion protein
MKNKILVGLAILGITLGVWTAYHMKPDRKPQPPAFTPTSNPYEKGIYANGIVESFQGGGENINIYPEVSGTVSKVLVSEGGQVKAGDTLFMLDDTLQRSVAEQQKAQADLAQAQIDVAAANLKTVQDQFDKLNAAAATDPKLVSKDSLDTARNTVNVGRANVQAAAKQYQVMLKSWQASMALLDKYNVRAMTGGSILSINVSPGSYISSLGAYDSYTGEQKPVVIMGNTEGGLAVRCYVDEILIQRLPNLDHVQAQMSVHGTDISIPLKFVRVQPNVSPKIELSSQRTERVDVRVLPIIFSFDTQKDMPVYPGQLVDVYINAQLESKAN